ncbi:hypothetical protein EDD85DRAFT_948045 [Armillaria nabsnona]|nr:hypothetical protein EDD85DRAFT_948045 [Armillaria nabsnona]
MKRRFVFCSSTDDGSLPSRIGHCLADRAKKGFNILYGVGVGEISDMNVPNVFRDLPLVGYDIMQLNESYWTWVDTVIGKADVVGVRVALVPTWGSWITVGVAIFTRTTRCIPKIRGGDNNATRPPRHEISAGKANQTSTNIMDYGTIFNALAFSMYDAEKALLPTGLESFNPYHATTFRFDTAPRPSLPSTSFGNETWLNVDGSQTDHAVVTRTNGQKPGDQWVP